MKHRFFWIAIVLSVATGSSAKARAQDGDAWENKKSAWILLSAADRGKAQEFAEDFKAYLNVARSALGSTREVIKRAQAAGFAEFTKPEQVKPGARLTVGLLSDNEFLLYPVKPNDVESQCWPCR